MPIGYLITTTLAGLLTSFAVLAPRTTRARRSTLRDWLGFMTNELPGILFVWLLASTLLAWSEGDLGSPVGTLALAVAVVTSAGLMLAAWRGARAGGVVAGALSESRPGARIAPGDRPPVASSLLAPFAVRRRDVERLSDIAYGDASRWTRSTCTGAAHGRRAARRWCSCTAAGSAADVRIVRRGCCSIGWRAAGGCASARPTG